MTLGEILYLADFEYLYDADSKQFVVSDNQDPDFEEIVESVQDVLDIVSGHLENYFNDIIELASDELNEPVPKLNNTWEGYLDWANAHKEAVKDIGDFNLEYSFGEMIKCLKCLLDPNTIEVESR